MNQKTKAINNDILIDPVYNYDKISKVPILLFDDSKESEHYCQNKKTIFQSYEYVESLLTERNISEFRMMLWSNKVKIIEDKIKTNQLASVLSKFKHDSDNQYNSYLERAFSNIPESWFQDDINDIYIIMTANPSDIKKILIDKFQDLCSKSKSNNLNFYIIFADCNFNNKGTYNRDLIYNYIKEGYSSNIVKQYLIYNPTRNNYVRIDYSNPDLMNGYISYKNKCFHIDNLKGFINYIDNLVLKTKKIQKLYDLLYYCCFVIAQIIKTNSSIIRNNIVELFARIFSIKLDYLQIIEKINDEIDAINDGHASTRNEYVIDINHKKRKFNAPSFKFKSCNDKFKNNISNYISTQSASYLSIPLAITNKNNHNDYCNEYLVLQVSNLYKFKNYKMGFSNYCYGALSWENNALPIIPKSDITTINYTDSNSKSIVNWIKRIYSNYYGIKRSSNLLVYMFLTEMVKIIISDATEDVKNSCRYIGSIMLNEIKFSNKTKTIMFLESNNILSSIQMTKMEQILELCSNRAFGNQNKISAYTLWYAIILSFVSSESVIVNNQLSLCQVDITKDFGIIDPKTLLFALGDKYKIKCNKKVIKEDNNLDYTCYITLDDTTDTGGYKVASHRNNNNTMCDPNFVLAEDGFESLKKFKKLGCPLCGKSLKESEFIKIGPKNNEEEIEETESKIYNISNRFEVNNHTILEPTKMISIINEQGYYDNIYKDKKLLPVDLLDFTTKSYDFVDTTIVKSVNKRQYLGIKTSEEFTKLLTPDYEFLKHLDWKNICIAGGFIKSILFNQTINDIDIFMYDINEDEISSKVEQIISILQSYFPQKFFLLANKKDTQVLEILIMDVVSIEASYNELILNTGTNQDPPDTKMYFETLTSGKIDPALLSKFQVLHKIQLITKSNNSIFDIINNFDLISSMVAFDGKQLLFNEAGYLSYKYMFNVVRKEYNYISLGRLIKYYDCGFNIVFHEHNNCDKNNCTLCNTYDTCKINRSRRYMTSVLYREISMYNVGTKYKNNNILKAFKINLKKQKIVLEEPVQNDDVGAIGAVGNVGSVGNVGTVGASGSSEQNKPLSSGYYPSLTASGTKNALSTLIKYAEFKNKQEANNIIWKVYRSNNDINMSRDFLAHVNDKNTGTGNV
jgi:hypothetical protein